MKGHTLMQAIARANRVYPGKSCGIIVDYVNVFKYMKKALSEYAIGDDESTMPAKDINQLINQIDETIDTADQFLKELDIDVGEILEDQEIFDKLDDLRSAYNTIIENDNDKNKFKVILNTLMNLYEASKPEIFEKGWENDKFRALAYLHGLFFNLIDDEKIARARLRMAQVLDNSVISNSDNSEQYQYKIHEGKIIDISKIDVEELKKEIKSSKYKAVEINDLREHIEKALEQMLAKNCTRRKFSERYKGIIDQYNAGGSENEDYYEKLAELIEDMKKETQRPILEGLSEEELEVYDLLIADKRLTKAEEQKVKLAAKNLYKKLTENKKKLFVVDWYKDDKPLAYVRSEVSKSLDSDLPEAYDKDSFNVKVDLLVKHFMDMSVQGYGWVAH